MAQRRYRIQFVSKFKRTIVADDDVAARRIAEGLSVTPGEASRILDIWRKLHAELHVLKPDDGIEDPELAWNIIEKLEDI